MSNTNDYGQPYQQPAMPQQPAPQQPAPKAKRRWPWIVAIPVAFFVGVGIGAVPTEPTTTTAADVEPAAAPTVTVTAEPAPAETVTVPGPTKTVTVAPKAPAPPKAPVEPKAATFGGAGTYVVGDDIAPGTYKSRPDSGGIGMCVWQRLENTSGEISAVIASNISQGPVTVTIKSSDGAFETSGCSDWVAVN